MQFRDHPTLCDAGRRGPNRSRSIRALVGAATRTLPSSRRETYPVCGSAYRGAA